MNKVFRLIRQKLLSENQFSKYMLYAIGEIVLVVIGILIALQINNWNDNRKSQLKIYQTFKKVRNELVLNINNSNSVTTNYRVKEKDLGRVLRREVVLEDYQNSNLAYLIWNYDTSEISNNVAREFDGFTNLLNKEQDSLVTRIDKLYGEFKPTLDDLDEEIGKAVNDFDSRLKTTATWYYLSNNLEDLPDVAYSYFLHDTLYLNDVAYYESTGLHNHLKYNAFFNSKAKDLYIDLSNYLKERIDSTLIRPVEQFEHYQGTFVLQNQKEKDTFVIRKQNNKLVYDWIDESGSDTYSLYPENNDEFFIAIWFGELIRNESNDVTGFKLTLGSRPEEVYKKID